MATRQRRQLQLTGFEMALIAVSFVLTVTAVFFLGLFVGKKNASYHASTEERVARIPVDDFTKYKRPAPIERPEKKPPPVEEASAASPEPAHASAGAAKAPIEAPASTAAAPAAAPAGAPVAVAAAPSAAAATPAAASAPAAVPASADAKKKSPEELAAEAAAAKEAAKAKELAAAKEAKEKEKQKAKELAAKEAEADTGRGYTVQILSTRKQGEADALVSKLKAHGYAAYIKKVSEGEGAWYRVRVGSYGAFGEARGMADKCRRDLGLGQAFVSTE
ncbi:MAG TPA: SPOR domain-containing protein [Candidatus Limnocylindrales bacterium]|nr:SPOR domain-containing protein [Candidatus Limnocylindrales bacterium]